jgi:voltage-gated potassium channel
LLTELTFAIVIVSICLLLHVTGILLMGQWLLRRREQLERSAGIFAYAGLLIGLFVLILLLHVAETSIWAMFYYSRVLFDNFETSLYFSMGSYTTIGYGDVVLPNRWRLLGAVEGISGVLLCGVSTAFIFAVMNALFQIRMKNRSGQ